MKMTEHISQTHDSRFRIPDTTPSVGGVELEYWVKGTGDPVVFLHGGVLTSWFGPLADELSRAGSYRLLSYHRPGYGSSSLPSQPITMAGQAECCLALMRHLGLGRAHLVGHSIGACIALEAALQEPEAVASVALLEPPVMTATADPSPALSVLHATAAQWKRGDLAGAMDAFMRGIVDPDYEHVLDRVLGTGWRDDALKGTDAFFRTDQPAVQAWRFEKPEAARVRQPTILFLGDNSTGVNPIREPVHRTLLSWLPNAEGHSLDGATHLLPLQEPARISALLTAFYEARITAQNHWDG
ncbi:MAG: alpha/beta hydrolase [Candidatus Dormibacteraeota bacterium]|nr:alpha/beta hydrolase [Candidatus Dormibacteraeota bacterium]